MSIRGCWRPRHSALVVALCLLGSPRYTPLYAQRTVAADPARNEHVGDVMTRPVTVQLQRVPVAKALETIASQAGVMIQFQAELVHQVRKMVTLNAERSPLGTILAQVLEGTHLQAVASARDAVTIQEMAPGAVDSVVTGSVMDAATQRPVVGATVTIEGLKLAERTDSRGMFRILAVPPGKYVLVVRRLGYGVRRQPLTVTGDARLAVSVSLSAVATKLDEVVTTVTGPQRRVELGNSIGLIKADSLVKEGPILTLSQLLTARVPGLSVSQAQGTVGGNITLQIRSASSMSLSNAPIVIVDGIRYNSQAPIDRGVTGEIAPRREPVSPLNDLNPNDIETIEVVRGPSAATLYGTDASNGVIVITTKRGKAGPPLWSAYGSTILNQIPKRAMAEDDYYYGWGHDFFSGDTTSNCDLLGAGDGWCTQDSVTHAPSVSANPAFSVFKPSQSWTSGVSVSGGQQVLRYFISGNYAGQTGAIGVPDTAIKLAKARGQMNLPAYFLRPNTQTKLNLQSNLTASVGNKINVSVNTGYTKAATRTIDINSSPFVTTLTAGTCGYCVANDVINMFSRTSEELNDRLVGNVTGSMRLKSWLSFNGGMGIDGATRNRHEFVARDSTRDWDANGVVIDERTHSTVASANAGVTAILRRGFASFRTSVGTQYARSTDDVGYTEGSDLVPGTTSIVFAANRTARESYLESVVLGNYLEETIGFNDRLFLTGAVRIDGASGFGAGYHTASYPKVSGSWLISKEPFMPRITGLTELRLRAAYGLSGRQPGPTEKLPSIGVPTRPAAAGGGSYLDLSTIGNSALRPERGSELETGIDGAALDQRLQFGLTWYRRRTTDQLAWQILPSGLGSQSANIGLTTGGGFEAQLTASVIETRPLSISFTLNHSSKWTKLVDIGGVVTYKDQDGGFVEGYPLGVRFTYPVSSYEDANNDGIPEVTFSDTAVYAGLVNAPRQQTLTTNISVFRLFRFSALFDREAGATSLVGYSCGRCRVAYDRTVPIPEQVAYIASLRGQAVSANYVRLREVSASIALPTSMVRSLRLRSGSVAISTSNLALWTSYPGADPQSRSFNRNGLYSTATTGIPQSRTWNIRFDAGL